MSKHCEIHTKKGGEACGINDIGKLLKVGCFMSPVEPGVKHIVKKPGKQGRSMQFPI